MMTPLPLRVVNGIVALVFTVATPATIVAAEAAVDGRGATPDVVSLTLEEALEESSCLFLPHGSMEWQVCGDEDDKDGECEECSAYEKGKVLLLCFSCFSAELTCIGAALTAWLLPPVPPGPKIAAFIAAVGACLMVTPTCLLCVAEAFQCNMLEMKTRAENAIQTAEDWLRDLLWWLEENSECDMEEDINECPEDPV